MKYISVAEMQAIEHEADANGWSYAQMMEAAGKGLAEAVQDSYGFLAEDGALALVGSGNNGGDALVALTHLAADGWPVTALVVRPRPADDPLLERVRAADGRILSLDASGLQGEIVSLSQITNLLAAHGLLLDGILGTGARLPLKPDLADVLGAVREAYYNLVRPPVIVAVDCPSGIDCDSGAAASECLQADLTVTMAAIKHGLLKFPAYDLVGELQVVGIGLPGDGEQLATWRSISTFIPDEDWIIQSLPQRPANAHKGTFGTVVVVAGSIAYTGAAYLAGQAAHRSGAGLVTLAAPLPLHAALAGHFPEATWIPLPDEAGFIAEEGVMAVRQALPRATALLVGPGFGLQSTTLRFLDNLFQIPDLPPLVLDADGLKLTSQLKDWPTRLPRNSVLTPHPGEMSILTGLSPQEIQANRLEMARKYSDEWQQVVILKGAFTVVAAPGGSTAVIPVAHPALARAGTGDVLSGLAAGLLAQGLEPFNAATVAAWIHATAGLRAAVEFGGSAPVLAGDVLNACIQILGEFGG